MSLSESKQLAAFTSESHSFANRSGLPASVNTVAVTF